MPPTEEGYSGGSGGNNSMNGPGHVGGANSQQPSQQKSNVIYFDTTKNELYRTSDTYKTLQVLKSCFFACPVYTCLVM